jgi:hypothetical protein
MTPSGVAAGGVSTWVMGGGKSGSQVAVRWTLEPTHARRRFGLYRASGA